MIQEIEATTAEQPNPLAILILMLNLVIASEADPYLLAGALIDGIAATVEAKIPPERQGEVAVEAMRLLRDRFVVRGAI